MSQPTCAELVVRYLEAQGVKHVFGVPGAKIDGVFNALVDSSIQTIVCRHEQNAAFIAGGIGRMTGKAGVALVTSGPGCANLVTGLATATTEGDPLVALGGAVAVADRLKRTHQSLDTVSLFRPVSKFSAEVDAPRALCEVLTSAFRAAEGGRPGAAFVSLPQDILRASAEGECFAPLPPPRLGPADQQAIATAATLINEARCPVLLLGLLASQPQSAAALRRLLAALPLPVVCTYQAAGVVPRELLQLFGGRVGLFHNQPGDQLLDAADVVVTIGYDPVEFDPDLWNRGKRRSIIHIDVVPAEIDNAYQPTVELMGDIAGTLTALTALLQPRERPAEVALLARVRHELDALRAEGLARRGRPIHPLRLVHELQDLLRDDCTICSDMGSFHIWVLRYLYSFRPRQLLITNGQQTLGVGLPWAIAACLVRPAEKVISLSGDGGFLFSAMELETAVRLKCNLVHIVWTDGYYDMVRIQEKMKYGRDSGVRFGTVDFAAYARAFGATGVRIDDPDQIAPALKQALDTAGPVIIEVPVDYTDNHQLYEQMRHEAIH